MRILLSKTEPFFSDIKMTDTKRKINPKSLSEDISALQEQVKQIETLKKKVLNMESMVEELKDKLKYYEDKEIESTSLKKKENILKCKFCEELFDDRMIMKGHIKMKHPRKINCEECDKTFNLNIDLEVHLESHKKPKMFQCSLCDKEFHLMWRLSKHLSSHGTSLKFCHYYNNDMLPSSAKPQLQLFWLSVALLSLLNSPPTT